MTHLKQKTFETIQQFVKQGGTVIADTLLPYEFLESEKDGASKQVSKLFGADPHKVLEEFQNGRSTNIKVHRKNGKGKAFFLKGKGLAQGGRKELQRVLEASVEPDVTISNGDVFYLHRQKDGHDIYFLVNTSQEPRNGVRVTFEQVGRPELWDANTGEITAIHLYDVSGGRLSLTLDFPPAESRIVVMTGEAPGLRVSDSNLVVETLDRSP